MSKIPKRKGAGQRRLPRTLAEYDKLPRRSQQALENVTHAITRMREGVSRSKAAAEFGVSPSTVAKLGKSALRKTKSGRYAAKPSDNLLRVLVVPVHGGRVEVGVLGSRKAKVIADRSNAQRKFAHGDASQLHALEGVTVLDASGREVPFLTDLDELERQADLGMLSFESIYARR